MKAVILVGGLGTRLRPLTCNTPKPMIPLLNRPFIESMLIRLRDQGIDEAILAVQYLADSFRLALGDGAQLGMRLHIVEEAEPRGTAGAVKQVADMLDDTTFIFNGDVLTDLDLRAMLAFHRAKGAAATIALTAVEDPTQFGLVEMDADQRVSRFLEKPRPEEITTNLINAGTYLIEPALLRYAPPNQHYMFERGLFPSALQNGDPIYGYPSKAYWTDIGKPEAYLEVHHDILIGKAHFAIEGHEIERRVWLQGQAEIDASAQIVGPVLIGPGARIGRDVRIVGPTVIGANCIIGPDVQIEGCVLWEDNRIEQGVHLRSCMLGRGNLIGANTVIGEGTIIGDGCQIGADNHLLRSMKIWPDTVLGKRSISF
jgi:mannose-1-phosphate guanylyltransferase